MQVFPRWRRYKVLGAVLCAVGILAASIFFSQHAYKSSQENLYTGNSAFDAYQKYSATYVQLSQKETPRVAIQALQADSDSNEELLSSCHDILHAIGRSAYATYGSIPAAMQFQNAFCNSGYIHGLFESYMKEHNESFEELATLCTQHIGSTRPFDMWQCTHGVGHGFMYYTGGDLDASLRYCNQYLRDESAVVSCKNGVYMEVFNGEVLNNEARFVDPAHPERTCTSRTDALDECYTYLPSYLAHSTQASFGDMFSFCAQFPSEYASLCSAGVGSEAMKRNMKSPQDVFDLCARAGGVSMQSACVFGMVSMFANQEGTLAHAAELCDPAPLMYRGLCRRIITSEKEFFGE